MHGGGEYLSRFFRFEFITDRYGNLEFEMDGNEFGIIDVYSFARSGKICDKIEEKLNNLF